MSIRNDSEFQSTVPARLARALADANDLRSAGLSALAQISQARVDALQLETLRLTARYGAESEQTRASTRRLDAAEKLQPVIQAELIRAQIPVPNPDPKAFILYGRLIDKNSAAVTGAAIVVSMADRKRVAEGKTGEQGDFVLTLPAQEGTPELQFEMTDSRGTTTTIVASFDLEPGVVCYREFVT
jgi:hypothetical protein